MRYRCKPDFFAATCEPADAPASGEPSGAEAAVREAAPFSDTAVARIIEAVEKHCGMGRGAWDMVSARDLVEGFAAVFHQERDADARRPHRHPRRTIMPTERKVRDYGPSMAHSITMALGDTDALLRSLCRAAVIAAMDIIEGKAPWFALSSITIGMAGEDADALRDRLYALRERLAAPDTQTEQP